MEEDGAGEEEAEERHLFVLSTGSTGEEVAEESSGGAVFTGHHRTE